LLANPITLFADSTAEEKQEKEKEAADAEASEKNYEFEQNRLGKLINKQEDDVEDAKAAHKSAQEAVDKAAEDDETQIMSIAEITRLLDREEYTRIGMELTSDLVSYRSLIQTQKSPSAS
jgi:hypothetical protein